MASVVSASDGSLTITREIDGGKLSWLYSVLYRV